MRKFNLAIKCILSFALGAAGFALLDRFFNKKTKEAEQTKEKRYFQLLDNWMNLLERGTDLKEFFLRSGFRKIAVYGYGNIGRHIVSQLAGTEVEVLYVVDKWAGLKTEGVERYTLGDKLPEVDAMVITPVMEYQSIETEMGRRISGKILSVEDIIYELL